MDFKTKLLNYFNINDEQYKELTKLIMIKSLFMAIMIVMELCQHQSWSNALIC